MTFCEFSFLGSNKSKHFLSSAKFKFVKRSHELISGEKGSYWKAIIVFFHQKFRKKLKFFQNQSYADAFHVQHFNRDVLNRLKIYVTYRKLTF